VKVLVARADLLPDVVEINEGLSNAFFEKIIISFNVLIIKLK
jgi:hypothetical protein